jgi:hypothetical protein
VYDVSGFNAAYCSGAVGWSYDLFGAGQCVARLKYNDAMLLTIF